MTPSQLIDVWAEESLKEYAARENALANGDLVAAQRHQSTADTLARCAKAMAALLESQDIRTAPTDGTSIIGWLPGFRLKLVLKWKNGCWREPLSDHAYRNDPPTRWWPLPKSPDAERES